MGGKKNTTFEQRQLVIYHYEKAQRSYREIANLLNMSKSTVGDIINRYKNEDRIESIPQPGRPKLLNDHDKRQLLRVVRQNPKISAPKLQTHMYEDHGKKVSCETIRRAIREFGFNGRVARKKPLINKMNKKKRKLFALEHRDKPDSFWNDVIFADESKYNLFGSDGRVMVWRKPNDELNLKNLRPTVKHGGESVMVWGCMSAAGVGELVFIDGIMDRLMYLNLLKENLKKSAANLGILDSFKFYQDNDPKHSAYIVQEWLLYNCPKVIKTPPQSPDLNPIENLWAKLEVEIRKHTITSKQQLKRVLKEEWNKIGADYTKN